MTGGGRTYRREAEASRDPSRTSASLAPCLAPEPNTEPALEDPGRWVRIDRLNEQIKEQMNKYLSQGSVSSPLMGTVS